MKKAKRLTAYILVIMLLLTAFAPTTVFAASYTHNAGAFVYTDNNSGVKFTVPSNWKQEEFTEDVDFLTAKFVSTKEASCIITFSSTDIWSQLPYFEKTISSRADIDNTIFTKADIAEICNTTEDEVLLYVYNGVEYYMCTITANKVVQGLSISVAMTQLAYINNGWMYVFQFSGTSKHSLYSDFESLIRSVKYPQVEESGLNNSTNVDTSSTQNSSIKQKENEFEIDFLIVFLLIVATLVAYGVFPVLFANIRKKPITAKKYKFICYGVNVGVMLIFLVATIAIGGSEYNVAPYMIWTSVFMAYGTKVLKRRNIIEDHTDTKNETNTTTISNGKFCTKCGKKLSGNNRYCTNCGERIPDVSLENEANNDNDT